MPAQTERTSWTDQDLDRVSWHDNHIHGFVITEGEHGGGELEFDLDFILEWLHPANTTGYTSRIAPASLTFHQVMSLKVSIDYSSAATGPFSIAGIERAVVPVGAYTGTFWRIPINWPKGEITFYAAGFTQVLRGPAIVTGDQCLTKEERGA